MAATNNITNTRKSAGFVYLIHDAAGLYKVGYSANPEARVLAMQSGNPRTLTLISKVAVDNRVEAERILHERLKNFHVIREWYSLDLTVWTDAILSLESRDKASVFWYRPAV